MIRVKLRVKALIDGQVRLPGAAVEVTEAAAAIMIARRLAVRLELQEVRELERPEQEQAD